MRRGMAVRFLEGEQRRAGQALPAAMQETGIIPAAQRTQGIMDALTQPGGGFGEAHEQHGPGQRPGRFQPPGA